MENPSKQLADEYLRLGGHRRAVIDDNIVSTRCWEKDTPEAAQFWKDRIDTLDAAHRRQVVSFLPTINRI
ncbi:hypothetical protein AM571_CH02269 [Rhizobium etli 8C-3]|uniref:Uncharacterized protein n=2 Tax=Rhizobium TaxID=379 RepID=A0A4R3QTS5_9HYPH|nr:MULTISPECIES: hypothetical protein [Rhizobium]APO75078.1 hypothetical protein AM571_CH02269 [Rhizobium etli 8C-3]TCU25770.1 hypothetical protein EV130_105428 [Rhizobium azibense]TCU39946.1 hypothetical protein EV129_10283 [Rhizobium azibense]